MKPWSWSNSRTCMSAVVDGLAGGDLARHQNRTEEARRLPGPERVAEAPRQLVERGLGGEGIQRPAGDPVQDPHVVDAGDVVGMRMGKQHRIHPRHPARQQLVSHIRRGIDQQSLPAVALDHDTGAGPPVARFRGSQAPQSPLPSAPPIIGTPAEPPVPSRITRIGSGRLAEQAAEIRGRQVGQRLPAPAADLGQHLAVCAT